VLRELSVIEITSFVAESSRSRSLFFTFFLELPANDAVLHPSPEIAKNYFNNSRRSLAGAFVLQPNTR
jgi:hypothetical protein